MVFSTAFLLFTTSALAAPSTLEGSVYYPCIGVFALARCCATDILGIEILACNTVNKHPSDKKDFENICAQEGRIAKCCLPALGLGKDSVCSDPN
jgi:hypothetical protein